MKKITKKSAMEMLNGEVKLIGAYFGIDEAMMEQILEQNRDKLKGIIDRLETRTCIKQSNNQIVFKLPSGEKTYLSNIVNNNWYLIEMDNFKFITMVNEYDTICYSI